MTLSQREVVGLAIQTLVGDNPDPTVMVPVISFSAPEDYEQILDKGRRGPDAADFGAYQGVGKCDISLEMPVYIMTDDSEKMIAGYFFHDMLGSTQAAPTQVGVTPVYNHILLLGTTKRYLTLEHTLLRTSSDRRFNACRTTEINIRYNRGEGAVMMRVNLVGKTPSSVEAQALTDLTSSLFKGWEAITVFEGAGSGRVISAEINIRRSSKPHYGNTAASQNFADLYTGPIELTCNLVADFSAIDDLTEFRTKGQAAWSITFRQGTANAADERKLAIGAAVMDWGDGPAVIDESGENVTLQLVGRSLYSTGNGPITGAAQNGPFEVVIRQLATGAYA